MKVNEPLLSTSVNTIMNNITGITSEDKATTMIINVTAGLNLTDYEANLQITSASNFLLCLRYMVQEYLIGGLTVEKNV